MKIAVLVNSLVRVGGIAKHTLRASQEFAQMGHQVTVWAVEYDPDNCYPELTKGLDVRGLRGPRPAETGQKAIAPGMRMAAYLLGLWQLYLDQRRFSTVIPGGYDVIHPNGNEIIWAAAEYKRRHGTPVVWMCNDFWPMASHRHERVPGVAGQLRHAAKSALSMPFERYDRAAVRDADRIAVLSEQVRGQMKRHYGVQPVIVRAGVDSTKFQSGDGWAARERLGIRHDSFLLLTVCELMSRRRLEDVIRAVRVLVDEGLDLTYVVAGRTSHSPDYTRFVQAEAFTTGLDGRVRFMGEVPEAELPDIYQACDAFVWASDENQSWGLAPMEAMAAGKPVIVSRANGLAEVLEDGQTALLVVPRSPEAIAAAVKRLIAGPPMRQALAGRGQELVREEYSWRRNAERMLELFARW